MTLLLFIIKRTCFAASIIARGTAVLTSVITRLACVQLEPRSFSNVKLFHSGVFISDFKIALPSLHRSMLLCGSHTIRI